MHAFGLQVQLPRQRGQGLTSFRVVRQRIHQAIYPIEEMFTHAWKCGDQTVGQGCQRLDATRSVWQLPHETQPGVKVLFAHVLEQLGQLLRQTGQRVGPVCKGEQLLRQLQQLNELFFNCVPGHGPQALRPAARPDNTRA